MRFLIFENIAQWYCAERMRDTAYSGRIVPERKTECIIRLMLKTDDIDPPKTGISVHLFSSLGERNCQTSLFSRMPHKRIEQTTC